MDCSASASLGGTKGWSVVQMTSSFPLCKVLGNRKLGADRCVRSLLYPSLNKETISKYKVDAGSLPLLRYCYREIFNLEGEQIFCVLQALL